MIFKKALCLSMAIGMLFTVGCGDKSKKSSNQEYGNTMIVNNEGLPFSIEFDSNFLTGEEASAIVNYYYSIEQQDEELANKCSYPDYLNYLCQTCEFDSIKDFLKSNYDTMGQVLGTEKYDFKSIKITKCFTTENKDVYTNFDEIDTMLDEAAEGTSSKIENRKLVEADIICTSDGKDISLTEKADGQLLYVYTIDGKPYVL